MIKTYVSAQILFEQAQKMELNPQWETPHGLFSFQHNDQPIYVFYTKLFINSQLGSWMCQDKYLTHVMAEKHHISHIPFCYTSQINEVNKFLNNHQEIVQKPVLGQKSENTYLIKEHDQIHKDKLDEWIFERYIPGNEYRCLALEGKVIAMQEKKLSPTPDHPWNKIYKTLGSAEWNKEMTSIAAKIAGLFEMGFIAVDFILDKDNKTWLLETNSMPGIYSFHHPDEGESINIAEMILKAILKSP